VVLVDCAAIQAVHAQQFVLVCTVEGDEVEVLETF
jgi:hypothetical protein